MSVLSNRLADCRHYIGQATLVAVTKKFPASTLEEAFQLGIIHFGENYVEEFEEKYSQLSKDIQNKAMFHMIGHVQGRKAGRVAKLFSWIDSVDSIKLVRTLDRHAADNGNKLHILFEVNLSGEGSKFGFDLVRWKKDPKKLKAFQEVVSKGMTLPNLIIEGLMTMPPYVTDLEDNRDIFRQMRELSETLRGRIPGFGHHLSMGTSCDYPVAVEEGATMVRLGEALFGKRESKKKNPKS